MPLKADELSGRRVNVGVIADCRLLTTNSQGERLEIPLATPIADVCLDDDFRGAHEAIRAGTVLLGIFIAPEGHGRGQVQMHELISVMNFTLNARQRAGLMNVIGSYVKQCGRSSILSVSCVLVRKRAAQR